MKHSINISLIPKSVGVGVVCWEKGINILEKKTSLVSDKNHV